MTESIGRGQRAAARIEERAFWIDDATAKELQMQSAAVARLFESIRPSLEAMAKLEAIFLPLEKRVGKLVTALAQFEKQIELMRPVLDHLAAELRELYAIHRPPTEFLGDYVVAAENPRVDPLVRNAWRALFAANLPIGYHIAIAKALPQPFRTRGRPRGHRNEIENAAADVRRRMADGQSLKNALTQHLNELGTGNATRAARRRTLVRILTEPAK